uniref:Uncharacterized protein n=1 Tax=Panagrellus redivivus TaxID=6233 RepID=A0A7E4UYE3_PANRE
MARRKNNRPTVDKQGHQGQRERDDLLVRSKRREEKSRRFDQFYWEATWLLRSVLLRSVLSGSRSCSLPFTALACLGRGVLGGLKA